MSVEAEFFAATKGELAQVQFVDYPYIPEGLDCEEWKGITEVELASLESILTGVPYETIMDGNGYKLVLEGDEEGPWVHSISTQLVSAIIGLPPTAARAAAVQWSQTEELEIWSAEDCLEVLEGLISLADRALKSGRELYLLNTL